MTSFAALHDRRNPLVLANVWDAASARLFEAMGCAALATTSAGVAWSLGYADGEACDVDELIGAVTRIRRSVRAFLSVDLEAGFASDVSDVVELAERVVAAGAVAINLEDWDPRNQAPYPIEFAVERIEALKRRFGSLLFVNARTDLMLQEAGDPGERLDATIARMRAFCAAGADCVFVPGVEDEPTIAALAAATPETPFNVLARRGTPDVSRLGQLGVARVSTGSGPFLNAYGKAQAVVRALLDTGTFAYANDPQTLPYGDVNALFSAHP